MNEILNFLVKYWQLISIILIIILEIVLMIFKKKPITNIFESSAYPNFACWIREAEAKFGSGEGEKKFLYVLEKYMENRPDLPKADARFVSEIIVNDILNTPTEKGGPGREQVKQEKK